MDIVAVSGAPGRIQVLGVIDAIREKYDAENRIFRPVLNGIK
jgi:hypothetical protein